MGRVEGFDFEDLVGAWQLESAVGSDETGRVSYPFGVEPEGVLAYTPDRWVSATITTVGPDPAPGACFYAGPVVTRENDIERRVVVGAPPFGPGTVQVRGVRLSRQELDVLGREVGDTPGRLFDVARTSGCGG